MVRKMSDSIRTSARRPGKRPRFAAFDGLAASGQGTMAVVRPARRIASFRNTSNPKRGSPGSAPRSGSSNVRGTTRSPER
jgi:hypothetical protein